MPTKPSRARRWIKAGKATPFWKKGIFCVRLNLEPSGQHKQRTACGIDPGGTWEAMTLKSKSQTYLNIQNDATTWVKNAIKTRREMRRGRRFRKTPCRKNKDNRSCLRGNRLAPSTKARWQTKLRLINTLKSIFPITDYIVEDIAAVTKPGQKRWNKSFSPIEVGKNWFYRELKKLGNLTTKKGYETAQLRDVLGLKKSKSKKNSFQAHCVDSWVLANSVVGGHQKPDTTSMMLFTPLRFHRRQLHRFQPSAGGVRRRYGGSMSLGLKRGSLIRHPKYDVCYVGGNLGGYVSLHSLSTGKRLTQSAKVVDCKFLSYNSWRWKMAA